MNDDMKVAKIQDLANKIMNNEELTNEDRNLATKLVNEEFTEMQEFLSTEVSFLVAEALMARMLKGSASTRDLMRVLSRLNLATEAFGTMLQMINQGDEE